ncbi:MAG: hypothetical protein K2H30_04815 [Clostridia bacterium]|nr:hypothetical protein [Clostridia bacterium]
MAVAQSTIVSFFIKLKAKKASGIDNIKAATIEIMVMPHEITLTVVVFNTERLKRKQYKNVSNKKPTGTNILRFFVAKCRIAARTIVTSKSSKLKNLNLVFVSFKNP